MHLHRLVEPIAQVPCQLAVASHDWIRFSLVPLSRGSGSLITITGCTVELGKQMVYPVIRVRDLIHSCKTAIEKTEHLENIGVAMT